MQHIRAAPLRSMTYPLGLPSLEGSDKARTKAANHLYAFTLLCLVIMVMRQAIVSIENPSSSYLWLVMYHFCQRNDMLMSIWLALEQVHFQACMRGSNRDEWTCWYSTPQVFDSIRAKCDHSHTHKSWAPTMDQSGKPVFPTASEAAYPLECTRRGVIFKDEALTATGHAEEQTLPSKRGHKSLPPLVAEYLLITDVCPENCDFKQLTRIPFDVKNGRVTDKTGKTASGMISGAIEELSSESPIPKLASSLQCTGHPNSLVRRLSPASTLWIMHSRCQTNC